MEEGEPAPPVEAAPAPEPPPATPPPPKARLWTCWEDRLGLGASALVLVASFLPWYVLSYSPFDAQPFLQPGSEALVAAGLAALMLLFFSFLRGQANERLRRQLSFLVGLGILVDTAYTASFYYLYHAGQNPRLGVVGHLAYLGPGLDLALLGALLLVWSSFRTLRLAPILRERAQPVEAHLSRSIRWGVPLLVFLAAFATYHANVEKPSIIDFDEAHYVRVAMNLTDGVLIDPAWGEPRPFNFEHPPVGKYLIAAGYWLAGEPHDNMTWNEYGEPSKNGLCTKDNPECSRDAWSWRIGSVFVGSLGVVGIYWIGLRLFRSLAAGLTAALLLLFDNLYYLQSRIAMLDIYAAAFALLAFGVFLGPKRGHRWAGSIILGLAVASKHYALFVVPAFFLLAFLVSTHPRRAGRVADAVLLAFVVPFATYLATYAPYLWIWARSGGLSNAYHMFLFVHQEGFRWTYRAELDKPHPYISRPWTWIPLRRPVFYFVGYDARQNVGHIYAIGNPYIWWTGCVAILYTLFALVPRWFLTKPRLGARAFWEWIARPFSLHREAALLFATMLFLCAYLPFFILKRDPFNFYFLIAAPFFSLLVAGYLGGLWDHRLGSRLLVIIYVALALAVFAFYHPVVAGTYISEQDFQYIMHRVPAMRQ